MHYTTKPVRVEAKQLTEETRDEICAWLNNYREWFYESTTDNNLYIKSKGLVQPSDWIVRGDGCVQILNNEMFAALYEPVRTAPDDHVMPETIAIASVLISKMDGDRISIGCTMHWRFGVANKDEMRGIAVARVMEMKPEFSIEDVLIEIIDLKEK